MASGNLSILFSLFTIQVLINVMGAYWPWLQSKHGCNLRKQLYGSFLLILTLVTETQSFIGDVMGNGAFAVVLNALPSVDSFFLIGKR